LQKIVKRKGSSKALTFSTPHILKAIFCLANQKYVSRAQFCKETKLGEGAVKTLILHLKEKGIVNTVKSGTFLTDKGLKISEKFSKAITSQIFLKKCSVTKGKYNYAILLNKEFSSGIGNGMEQRDYAILYGASDSLTLKFNGKEFVFVGDQMNCFSKEPDVRDYIIKTLNPKEGDILLITSSGDKFISEISAINTALGTLETSKNK